MWSRAAIAPSSKCQVLPLELFILESSKNFISQRNISIFPSNIINNIISNMKNSDVQVERSRKQRIIKSTEVGGIKTMFKIYPPPSAMKSQSIVLPGHERIRVSVRDDPLNLVEFPDPETRIIEDTLYRGALKTRTGNCMGFRTKSGAYEWYTYNNVIERKDYVASGLINLGISPSQSSMIGICTKTRPEFLLTMLGTSSCSMVLVPMYECIGPNALSSIMCQVQMQVIICETAKLASLMIENAKSNSNLKHIVLIDGTEEDVKKLKAESNFNVLTFKELEKAGKSDIKKLNKPLPNDLFCICYTSGTTGEPKGVVVTHRNVLSCIASMQTLFGEAVPTSGTLFAYLPCAHIYEIINEAYCLYCGGQLGYYSGNIESIVNDLADVKPDVLPLVPKLMNLIYTKVKKKVYSSPIKKFVFEFALNQKRKQLKKGIVSKNTFWDKFVFSEIQKTMGGSLQMIICSSAPVSKDVMDFFRCASGCMVFEAYGLSEVGAAAMTLVAEHNSGYVGPPLASNFIKLASVPDLNYDASNDAGEICIKGPNVFQGYFKNPEATEEALDKDGWFMTGDIGKWLPNGTLKIIDRKKHIFKLSQGEYIIPDKIEHVYMESRILFQVFVDGNANEDFVVAVVVPDSNAFITWANDNGFADSSLEELCQNEEVKKKVLKHMVELGKSKKLSSLFQVGNIFLTTEPFSQENNLLTPTLKLKRSEARKRFADIIQLMYEEGNLRKNLNL